MNNVVNSLLRLLALGRLVGGSGWPKAPDAATGKNLPMNCMTSEQVRAWQPHALAHDGKRWRRAKKFPERKPVMGAG